MEEKVDFGNFVNEDWFTEGRLEKFSLEYKRFPALWLPSHPKFRIMTARRGAYVRLAKAMGVRGGHGVANRAARLCRLFVTRLKHELARASAAAERGGGGAGGGRFALELVPRWARRADRYLQLLNTVQKFPESHTRRIVRAMRRAARHTGAPSRAAAAAAAQRLGQSAELVYELWSSMRAVSLQAAGALVLRGDALEPPRASTLEPPRGRALEPPRSSALEPRMAAMHWAVLDLLIMYDSYTLIKNEHYKSYETLRALVDTFQLVQRCGLEAAPPAPPAPPGAWRRAACLYSNKGVAASALALQRRWYELRLDTRRSLRSAWRRAHRPGPGGAGGGASRPSVLPIHQAIARRYPHVVTDDFTSWYELLRRGELARPTSERGPAPGEEGFGERDADSEDSYEESDDDLIIVEDNIETIDLDEDEIGAATHKAINPTDMPIISDEPDDADSSEDQDKGGREEGGVTTKEVNEENDENVDISKENDKTVDCDDHGNNECDRKIYSTKKPSKKINETISSNDHSNNELKKEIDNTKESSKEIDKTAGVSVNGDKPIEVIKEIDKTVDANIEANNTNGVSKIIDKTVNVTNKTIGFGDKPADLKENQDRDLLKALQELDVDDIQASILFESDEEANLKIDHHSDDIDDHVQNASDKTEKAMLNDVSEKIQSNKPELGNVINDSEKAEDVSKASGEKKRNGDLGKIQNKEFNKIQESINDESVVNKADPNLNNEKQLCIDTDVVSNKVVAVSESHTSIYKVRRHSESSESDSENLVIDDNFSENDNIDDENSKSTDNAETNDEASKNKLLAIGDETSSKDSFSSNSEEVENSTSTKTPSEHRMSVLTQKPSSKPNNSKRDEPETGGSTHIRKRSHPLLSDMLLSPIDDVERFKIFKEIEEKMKAQKSLEAEEERASKKAKVEEAARGVVTKSKINQYAKDLIDELVDESGAGEATDDLEDDFDPKLLMCPVVFLTRLEDSYLRPTLVPRTPCFNSFDPTLTPKFVFHKRNVALLKLCKPCVVVVERLDVGGAVVGAGEARGGRGGRGGRVHKRVELPNIDDVRRNNRRIATAQVAPIRDQRPECGADAGDADVGVGAGVGAGAAAGRWEAPSVDDLHRLLDDLATAACAPGAGAGAGVGAAPCRAHACASAEPESVGLVRSVMRRGCARCAERLLCAAPASKAVADMQRRLVRRWATQARHPHTTTQAVSEKEKIRKTNRREQASKPPPAPAPEPAPESEPELEPARARSRSPYDESSALREWVRQKNFVSEKFGIKPRSYKKAVPPVQAVADPATITPLRPSSAATAPPLPLGNERTTVDAKTKTLVTLNKSREVNETPLVVGDASQLTLHYLVDSSGAVVSAAPPAPRPPLAPTSGPPARFSVDAERAAGLSENPDGAATSISLVPTAGSSIGTGPAGFPENSGPSAGLFIDLDATSSVHAPRQYSINGEQSEGSSTNPERGAGSMGTGLAGDAASNQLLQYVLNTYPEEGFHQKQPNIFNRSAVADINKKLTHLASSDSPPYNRTVYMDAESSMENTFFPIITNVQSLAKDSPDLKKTSSQKLSNIKVIQNQNSLCQKKTQARPKTQSRQKPQTQVLKEIQKNIVYEQQTLGLLNTRSFGLAQANQTQPGVQAGKQKGFPRSVTNSLPHLTIDASGPQVGGLVQGKLLNSELPQANNNLTDEPNYVISGGYLTTQCGYLLHPSNQAQNEMQSQLDQQLIGRQPLPVSSVPAGPSPLLQSNAQTNLNMMLASSPITLHNQHNALQATICTSQDNMAVNSHFMLMTSPQTLQGELQVNSVQVGQPQASGVQLGQQSAIQMNPHVLQVNSLASPLGVLLTNEQVNAFQGSVQAGSQANLGMMLATQSLQGSSQAGALPVNASQVTSLQAEDLYCNTRTLTDLPPVRAEDYLRGRDPTTLTVAALTRGAWRLAGHLLLSEAPAAPSSELYALQPLRQLILPGEEEGKRKHSEPARASPPPKVRKTNETVTSPNLSDPPKNSWLKVRSFAKMADSELTQEATDAQEKNPMIIKAPESVHLENKVYQKLCDAPLIYAKVLSGVCGAAACRDLLLRRAPVYSYCLRTGALTHVPAQPAPDGATIVLTATKQTFAFIQELAKVLGPLNPPDPPLPEPAEPKPSKQVINTDTMIKQSSPRKADKPMPKLVRYVTLKSKVVNGVEYASTVMMDKGKAAGGARGQAAGGARGQAEKGGKGQRKRQKVKRQDGNGRTDGIRSTSVITIDSSDEE